jgi:hypothetical protein
MRALKSWLSAFQSREFRTKEELPIMQTDEGFEIMVKRISK